MDIVILMAAPVALACLLVAIHAYLGLHVLEREVIFVDISLSQVAALGAAVSLFFWKEGEGEIYALFLSLALCLAVSFVLALLRRYEKSVSQEALIGMTYAAASGALILVADRLPHGAEHLKEALVGNILFVTWSQVFTTAAIYAAIGAVHWIFRSKFWAATRGEGDLFWWDFLFYFLFGIVITFSTRHAGVLVVFAILVAPAALASRFARDLRARLAIAWLLGMLGVLVAFAASYAGDLPAGATLVCTLTVLFFASLMFRRTVVVGSDD